MSELGVSELIAEIILIDLRPAGAVVLVWVGCYLSLFGPRLGHSWLVREGQVGPLAQRQPDWLGLWVSQAGSEPPVEAAGASRARLRRPILVRELERHHPLARSPISSTQRVGK